MRLITVVGHPRESAWRGGHFFPALSSGFLYGTRHDAVVLRHSCFETWPCHRVLPQTRYFTPVVSLKPGLNECQRNSAGDDPVIDWHPVQEGLGVELLPIATC